MNKSSAITVVILVVLVLAGIGLWSAMRSANDQTGTVVLAITDATADIKSVSEVDMTVNKIEVYSQAKGWVTLSANPKTYHLLALNQSGQLAFYDKVEAPVGIYDQVRLTLGDVVVKLNNNSSAKATLPSSTMTIDDTVRIMPDQTSVLTFDFKASDSLRSTTNGKFVFAPVVSYKSYANASADLNSDNTVSIANGETASSGNVGMDVNGETRANFMIEASTTLNVNEKGIIMIGATSSGKASGSGSASSGLLQINGAGSSSNSVGGVINY